MNSIHWTAPITIVALSVIAAPLLAAELRLKSECQPSGGLVCLGDVAEIFASDAVQAERLAAIDLMPSPAAGEKRLLRVRELQDLLALRGMNLAEHRFSGASHVTIGSATRDVRPLPSKAGAPFASAKTTVAVREAIVRYLVERQPETEGWQMKLDLDDEQAQTIAAARQGIAVEGGASPWTGPQQFLIVCTLSDRIVRVPVAAQVSLPPSVVVAAQALARGTIVRPSDVRLQAGNPTEGSVRVFQSLDDVIGKETTRVITAGQILDDELVQQPLLVRRGEIVTVYARSAGIRVRTTARARDDGSQGELVTVESLSDRKTFFARVCGAQEVEIFAQAMQVPQVPAKPQQAGTPALQFSNR